MVDSAEAWKEKVRAVAYASQWRKNFGHKCDLNRKTEEIINQAVRRFLRVYPHSRRYETRRYNRENNTHGTFLDTIKNDVMLRDIFYAMLVDYIGEEAPINGQTNVLAEVIMPLAKKRGDKSKGYNATLRLVYNTMPVCWKNRMTRTGCTNKSEIIMKDKKLQKLFRETAEKMLEEINEEINAR